MANPASNPDPLSQLRDIHLPDPVSYWPPAPGWWILAIFLLLGIGFVSVFIYKIWRKNRYRTLALREIQHLRLSLKGAENESEAIRNYLMQLNILLRRVALAYYPREQVASLSGKDWLHFLDSSGGTQQFSNGVGMALGLGPYQASPKVDVDQLHRLSCNWIKNHQTVSSSGAH